ncbi:MAG: hypothetical protein V5A62_12620 [Haloarculaceae archaeon]
MDVSGVDALLDAFGPFFLPVALFAAGVVGYGFLFLVGRLMAAEGAGWWTETAEGSDDTTDAERHEG